MTSAGARLPDGDFITLILIEGEIYRVLAGEDRPVNPGIPPPAAVPAPPAACAPRAFAPSVPHGADREDRRPAAPAARLPAPTLRPLCVSRTLQETGRLLALLDHARAQGLCGPSAPDRLRFVALAEHALRVGSKNPCGLFARLLGRQCWDFITDADDAAAQQRLKADNGIDTQRRAQPSPGVPPPTFSEDARFVDRVLRVLPSEWRDRPFLAVKMQDPEWTRERWDTACNELAQARQAWAQPQTLHRLLERDKGELSGLSPGAACCPECGEARPACACQEVEDDTYG